MKVTQEKLPASQIGLEIEITPEMSKKVYERVVQDFTRSANIPGFRKGKVPRQILIQRIGSLRIKASAVEELVEDSLKAAVKQENIEALGNFQLLSSFDELVSQFEPGQPLTFSASVDVPPEVTLQQYSGLKVQAEEIKPDPDRLTATLDKYQQQLATLIPVEGRAAQLKDVAVVDFKGVFPSEEPDGEPEPIPGAEAQDFQVELDEGRFIEGFIDGIIGMNPSETKEIEAIFPDTYPQAEVAGRTATFTVTLKELKEKELPELDDEFAQDASDGEYQTLADLQSSLESRFQEEAETKTRDNQEKAVLDELLNHVEVDIPETLIEREVTFMINQTAMQLQNQGIDVRQLFTQEMVDRLKIQSRPDAIQRIKRTLALGEIAKQESITVQPEELSVRLNEIIEDLGDRSRDIDRERLESVVSEDLLKEKIMDWLIEHSEIELVPEGSLTPPDSDDTEALETAPATAVGDGETIDVVSEPVLEGSEESSSVDSTDSTVPSTEEPATKKKRAKSAKSEEVVNSGEPTAESPAFEPEATEAESAEAELTEAEPAPKARKSSKKAKVADED